MRPLTEMAGAAMETARDAMRPVYMPSYVRVCAILVGLVIMLPPLLHTTAHAYLMLAHPEASGTMHGLGSDWTRVVQIVIGAGVGFPDPVVRVVRALRPGKNGPGGDA